MRNCLIICGLIIFITIILVLRLKKTDYNTVFMPVKAPILTSNLTQDKDVIDSINIKNSLINTLYYNMKIEISDVEQELSGQIFYEKTKKFRIIIQSKIGTEMDIGSNELDFWFWSKRMKRPSLYYCSWNEVSMCNLKAPLNPAWMINLLNVNKIEPNAKVMRLNDKIAIIENYMGLLKITLINPKIFNVIGNYLYNSNWKLVASSEVLEFQQDLPKKIRIIWAEENISMIWYLNDVKKNFKIPSHAWNMPNMKNRNNMAYLPNAR